MKIQVEGRLAGFDSKSRFALESILREFSIAIDHLSSQGLDTLGTIIIDTAATGIILKDTQATPHYWRVKVSNLGVLTTTDLGTTRPQL